MKDALPSCTGNFRYETGYQLLLFNDDKRVKSASLIKDGFGGFVRHCSFNSCRLSAIREPDCVVTMK